MEKQKIYEKTWFIILMLFLLAPVGIILLWREKKFNNIVRIILSILFGLVFLIAVIPSNETSSNVNAQKENNIEIQKQSSDDVEDTYDSDEIANTEETQTQEEPAEEIIELTDEEKFENELSEYLSDNNGELSYIEWDAEYGENEESIIIEFKAMNDEDVVSEHASFIVSLLNKYNFVKSTDLIVSDISGDVTANLTIITINEDRELEVVFENAYYNTNYNKWLNSQFSLWDGAHTELEKLIVKNLNDEKSYDHIETTYRTLRTQEDVDELNEILSDAGYSARVEIDDVYILTQFSAKNAFNATIKNTAVGIASYNNNTILLVDILSN